MKIRDWISGTSFAWLLPGFATRFSVPDSWCGWFVAGLVERIAASVGLHGRLIDSPRLAGLPEIFATSLLVGLEVLVIVLKIALSRSSSTVSNTAEPATATGSAALGRHVTGPRLSGSPLDRGVAPDPARGHSTHPPPDLFPVGRPPGPRRDLRVTCSSRDPGTWHQRGEMNPTADFPRIPPCHSG